MRQSSFEALSQGKLTQESEQEETPLDASEDTIDYVLIEE